MNLHLIFASILLAIGFTGCATFTPAEMGQIRQHGVSPVVVNKMEDGRVLHPGDVIELTRRGVPDSFIIRQIDDTGVDYVLNRNDVKRMQEAHVSHRVMDALIVASEDFAGHYAPGGHVHAYAAYPSDYYEPYYGYSTYFYPYGGVSVVIGGGHCWGGGGHHWH
jgi:hypothetical protein